MLRLTMIVLILTLASGVLAADRRKNNRNNNQNNQARNQQKQLIGKSISAHQQAAARAKDIHAAASQAAQSAAFRAQSAQQQAQSAALLIANLETQVEHATDGLRQVEELIINSHGEDSKLAQAIADVEQTQGTYVDVRRNLLKSPSYKAAYQRALSSRDKAKALPEVRRTYIDNNEELRAAEADFDAARLRLERIRSEVLTSNPDWASAADEVREAKAGLVAAKIELKNGALGKASATNHYLNAAAAATAAAEIAARSEARIKSLQAQQERIAEQQRRDRNNRNRNNRSDSLKR